MAIWKRLKIDKTKTVESSEQNQQNPQNPDSTKLGLFQATRHKLQQIKIPKLIPYFNQQPDSQDLQKVEVKLDKRSEKTPKNTQIKAILDKFTKKSNSDDIKTIEQIDEKLEQTHAGRIKAIFHQFLKRVKPEDVDKINKNLEKMKRGPVKDIWSKVQALAKMVRDPKVAWKSKAVAIATLVYLISPFDAIPDVIPFAGLADDAALIVAVVSTFAYELENYLVRQAEKQAEIEVRKYNRIVRIALVGSIIAAVLAIVVKLIYERL